MKERGRIGVKVDDFQTDLASSQPLCTSASANRRSAQLQSVARVHS